MTVDVRDQLRELCAVIENEQGPITESDIEALGVPTITGGQSRSLAHSHGRQMMAAVGAAAIVLALFGGIGWLQRSNGVDAAADPSDPPVVATSTPSSTEAPASRGTLSVTVRGVMGHDGDQLAGVLYPGASLIDLDRDAIGGFSMSISGDQFTGTETVRAPDDLGVGPFPFVSDEEVDLEPGEYTLVLWVDTGLNPADRWVPINTDGQGLFGCQTVIEVGSNRQADFTVTANLSPNGWNIDCATGEALPGTESINSFQPSASMPVPTGVEDGQTVEIGLSGLRGHEGNELGVVVYEGSELTNPHEDVIGGFWSLVTSDDFTITEVVRELGPLGSGRFPFATSEALKVEPGNYTLVVWVDTGLPSDRRVPFNTDGQGLFGCQMPFEVGNDPQTQISVDAYLHPNGWNIDCRSGQVVPGTNADDGIVPPDAVEQSSMPPVTGLGAGQTVSVTVTGLSGHDGHHLAGVLYEGELTSLEDAIGGFWSPITGDDYTTTEVVREPGSLDTGRYPHVLADALVVEPGPYTLVVWVDVALNTADRWAPINTDGQGLYGCRTVFDVDDNPQTDVTVTPHLEPDGWDVSCHG